MAEIKEEIMKKKLLGLFALVSLIAFSGALTLTKDKTAYHLLAEEESSEVAEESSEEELPPQDSEEPAPVEEPVEEESESKIKDAMLNFKDTFLVPLVSTLSLSTLVGAGVSIAVALLNKKNNNELKEKVLETQKQVACALKAVEDTVTIADKIIERTKNINERLDEAFKKLDDNTGEMVEKTAQLVSSSEKMLEIKKCVVMLVEVQSEIVKHDPQAISNGLAKRISEINEQAKKMLS